MKAILDLHTHTIVSGHAYSTVQENIEAAKKIGLKYLGMSEHAPSMPGGPHPFYFQNIYVIPKEVDGVRVLRGIEGNIIDFDGNIDVTDEMALHLDYIIASLHSPCLKGGTKEENTNAYLKAMNHPKVKIIGHPDDSRFIFDKEIVIKNAKEKNILIEINNSSLKPDSFREGSRENIIELLRLCKKYNVRVVLGSDAHISYDVGKFIYNGNIIEEVDFPKELVINYHEEQIKEFFNL